MIGQSDHTESEKKLGTIQTLDYHQLSLMELLEAAAELSLTEEPIPLSLTSQLDVRFYKYKNHQSRIIYYYIY